MNSARDNFGNFAKFVPPLVVNGRVYVATFSNQVAVYGLLGTGGGGRRLERESRGGGRRGRHCEQRHGAGQWGLG